MHIPFTKTDLTRAGWLSIIIGPFIIPYTIYLFLKGLSGNMELSFIDIAFSIFYTAVNVYVYLLFKELLNKKYAFHKVDTYLLFWLGFSVVSNILDVINYLVGGLTPFLAPISILLLIPMGITTIIFGKRLLSLKDSLFGLRKPLAYVSIIIGISFVTLLLSPLGIIFAAISDILVGVILLRAAKNFKK
jgi:hypothetical protein